MITVVMMKSNYSINKSFALILVLSCLVNLVDAQNEDKELLNCLCSCLEPPGGQFVCTYDTEDRGWSPSCRDLSNGPCICKAYGCFRGPLPTEGECYDECYAKKSPVTPQPPSTPPQPPSTPPQPPSSGPSGEQAAAAAAGAGILATIWAAVSNFLTKSEGGRGVPTTLPVPGPGQQDRTGTEVMRRIQKDRERMKRLEAESAWRNSWLGWLTTYGSEYSKAVWEDISTLPDYARKLGRGAKDAVKTAYRELTDRKNWRALGEATVDTFRDVFTRPVESTKKIGRFYWNAGKGAVNVANGISKDPVGFAKTILGIDNWEKVVDGKVPLGERLLRALYGAVDTTMNIATAKGLAKGLAAKTTKVLDTALDTGRGAKVVDAALDTGRGAKVMDAGADTAKTVDAIDDLTDAEKVAKRRKAWQQARRAGKNKVDEFKKAIRSGDRSRIRKAALDIQGDKQALREINRRSDALKKAMNAEMNSIYRKTDRNVIKRVARELGVDPKDVKMVKPTNPSDVVKVGADRDITVRITKEIKVNGKISKIEFDVPHEKLQRIYDEEFYKAAKGHKYAPGMKPSEFTKKMDQVCTSSTHPDAYGIKADPKLHPTHPGDLDIALKHPGRDFLDPTGVGKTAAYKGHELFRESEKIRHINPAKAEELMGEGMRQVTKQYKNQVIARANALRAQGYAVKVPDKLDDAIKILNRVDKGLAPVDAEKLLKEIGYTPDKVATRIGEVIEEMQKLKPR